MNALQIGIMIFTILEIGNVCILYFMPETTMANGIGVFNAWDKSKEDPQIHSFIKYLVNWVAGAKLIFVLMGIVVIIFGNELTQIFTVVALIISILSFYYRLFPSIKKMDSLGEITPKGYSKTLNFMIASFIIGFIAVLVIYLLT